MAEAMERAVCCCWLNAALFMDSQPKPDQPLSEALAHARARCDAVSSTPEVGGPSVEVGHSAEHALCSLDGQ